MASKFLPSEGFMRERYSTACWPSRYTSFWRCGTGASTFSCSHSAHKSWRFFSHDGQNDLPRQEKHPLDHRPQRAMLPSEADGPDSQQLLEVLLDQAEQR